jgi:hypothetical protein
MAEAAERLLKQLAVLQKELQALDRYYTLMAHLISYDMSEEDDKWLTDINEADKSNEQHYQKALAYYKEQCASLLVVLNQEVDYLAGLSQQLQQSEQIETLHLLLKEIQEKNKYYKHVLQALSTCKQSMEEIAANQQAILAAINGISESEIFELECEPERTNANFKTAIVILVEAFLHHNIANLKNKAAIMQKQMDAIKPLASEADSIIQMCQWFINKRKGTLPDTASSGNIFVPIDAPTKDNTAEQIALTRSAAQYRQF